MFLVFSRAHWGAVQEPQRVPHGSDIIREVVRHCNFEVFMSWWSNKTSLKAGSSGSLGTRPADPGQSSHTGGMRTRWCPVPQPLVGAQSGIWSPEDLGASGQCNFQMLVLGRQLEPVGQIYSRYNAHLGYLSIPDRITTVQDTRGAPGPPLVDSEKTRNI